MDGKQENKLTVYVTETIEEADDVIDTKDTTPILGKPEDVHPKNKLLGGVLAFLSSLLFTASSVILQQLSINFSDAMVVRYSLQVVTLLTVITCINRKKRYEGKEADRGNSGNHLQKSTVPLMFQGLCNGICVLGEFMCVSFMPIGDATAIIFSSPLPSMVLSTIFLGHSLRLYKIGCGMMLYLGVLFVVKPPFLFKGFKDFANSTAIPEPTLAPDLPGYHSTYYIGAAMGLVAACARSAHYVTCSVLYKNSAASTLQMILYAGFGGFIVSLVSSAFDQNHLILSSEISTISLPVWCGICSVAFLGVCAIFMLTYAIALSNPVLVSFVRVFDIVVSYLIQIIFLHDSPAILGIVGSSFVVSSVSLLSFENSFRNWIPSSMKKIF